MQDDLSIHRTAGDRRKMTVTSILLSGRNSIHTSNFIQILRDVSINFSGIGVTQMCPNLRRQASEHIGYFEHGLPILLKVNTSKSRLDLQPDFGG